MSAPKSQQKSTLNFSLISFVISTLFITFLAGFLVREHELFPYKLYVQATKGFQKVTDALLGRHPWYYPTLEQDFPAVTDNSQAYEGLTLVTQIDPQLNMGAQIVDLQGNIVHKWDVDFFKMWPNPEHVPEEKRPQIKPAGIIHGAVLAENGDLIFNMADFGLMRINRDSEVVWKLPYMTHHSVHLHDDGKLWVSGYRYHDKKDPRLPHLQPPYYEDTILEVTTDGEITREWSVTDLLIKNGYNSLLYMRSQGDASTKISPPGDIFHLNDIEPFPSNLEEGFFTKDDVIVSIRNVNMIFVFNTKTDEIKYINTGSFIRQHDPDFIDGNTISIFDNNNGEQENPQSRIILLSALDNTSKVYYEGTPEQPFYTPIMGKHQWLPNGNLLITETCWGRGFEINNQGEIVWQYVNYIEKDKNVVGFVSETQRLDAKYTEIFSSPE